MCYEATLDLTTCLQRPVRSHLFDTTSARSTSMSMGGASISAGPRVFATPGGSLDQKYILNSNNLTFLDRAWANNPLPLIGLSFTIVFGERYERFSIPQTLLRLV